MTHTIAVVDYGSGNLHSVSRAITRVGASPVVTRDADEIAGADALVIPGVGHFGACMRAIRGLGMHSAIEDFRATGRPVFGVCVGMQVLFETGLEHGVRTEGCGEWPGVVERLTAPVLPHMGWNTVRPAPGSLLFDGVEGERFYFVHSYAVRQWQLPEAEHLPAAQVTWADHGEPFVAAVENGPLSATQFHPEKSGDAGAALLRNWVRNL